MVSARLQHLRQASAGGVVLSESAGGGLNALNILFLLAPPQWVLVQELAKLLVKAKLLARVMKPTTAVLMQWL